MITKFKIFERSSNLIKNQIFESNRLFTETEEYIEFTLGDLWSTLCITNVKTDEVDYDKTNERFKDEIERLLINKHISYRCGIYEHKDEIREGDVKGLEFGYYDMDDHDEVEVFVIFSNEPAPIIEHYMEHTVDQNKPIRIYHIESDAIKYNL